MSRKNKTISFNTEDPHELVLFEHAEKINPLTGKPQNFSKYVKRLIEEDMKRGQRGNESDASGLTIIDVKNDDDETYTLEVSSAMNSFL